MSATEHNPFVGTLGTYEPDNLLLGSGQWRGTDTVTVATGLILPRGAALGRVTATGEYKLATSAASDGSQDLTQVVILGVAIDTNTVPGAKPAVVYTSGEFNARAVTLGAGVTLAALRTAVRPRSLFFRNTSPA